MINSINWEAMGAVAELIGGAAVLVTLIYLSIQVKQNTAIAREAILRNQTDRNMDNSKFIAGTPGMMDIYIRTMDDPGAVTREERWRFGSYMYGMFLDFQEAYHFNISQRQVDYSAVLGSTANASVSHKSSGRHTGASTNTLGKPS